MKTHLLTRLLTGISKSFTPNKRSGNNTQANGTSHKLNFLIFLLAIILLVLGQKGYSQTNTWNGGGGNNWSSPTRWSQGHIPTAAEDVVVPNNKTLNIDMAGVCNSFTIQGGNSANTVTITSSTNSLTVTGAISIGAGTGNNDDKILAVGAGTLTAASISIAETGGDNRTSGVSLSTGTINVSGDITMDGSSIRNTFTVTGNGVLNFGGNFLGINGGIFSPGTGTVNMNGATAQTMSGLNTVSFYNLNINKTAVGNTVTSTTNVCSIANNLTVTQGTLDFQVANAYTIGGSVILTAGTFNADLSTNINVAGTWTNNGGTFTASTGRVTFNGTLAQTINGSTATTFNNVTINNSNGVTLSSVDMTISGAAAALTFSNGKITTGSNKVSLGSSATISGAGTGKYIYGNLQMGVAIGSPTRVFEIGDAAVYAPLSVVFNSVTVAGNANAYTIGTEHPNILTSTIDESKSVNRYWSMSNSGISLTNYTATFNWVAGDVDAGATTANFIIGRRTSSWAYPSMGARNPTNCTTTLSSFGTYACGEGGAAIPSITTQPTDQTACSGTSVSYTAIANDKPTSTVTWQISTNNGASFSNLTIASPYSVSTSTVSGVTTSTLTINPTSSSMDGYSYRAVFTNSRGSATSFDGLLTINLSPTANAGSALSPICGGGSSAPLGGSVGGSATGGTWSTPAGGTFSPSATTLNATWTPPGGYSGTATLTLTTSGGSCGSVTASKTQVVSAGAGAITITPASASICVNAIQSLAASNTETSTFSSGTVNVSIPDVLPTGATNTIAVSGIPTGAVVTGLSVTINVTHTKDQDLIMNLRAPNGSILNLINTRGGSGSNFTNTVINSTSSTSITGGAPFTGTFKPDATNGVGAVGQTSNVTAFSSLYSTANGNWVFSAVDGALFNTGTINSWTLAITYVDPITWSPVTYLYTNAAATTAYTAGTVASTVYAKPTTQGTYTYTATATNSGGCTSTQTVAVTAGPVVTVTPDYCYGSGYIQLTATSSPAATSWLWSTGATTSSILVNLAGNYTVTATTGGGCVSSVTAPIAQELVTNGDFSSGNTGFTSAYGAVAYTSGCMYPEAIYTVGPTPNFTHSYFFGKDHTTGSGNLMIVNGSGSPVSVWQETIAVQPNTTYYFSAWAMSLNDASPFAQLQFDINGSGIGTTAVLPAGPNSTSAPFSWVQFYGSWTSGAGVTSATVSIKDLQTALGGNDFGLDDISFGTLATFVSLSSASGTDAQTVCANSAISNITYSVGSGSGGPAVSGLPAGVSYTFTGTTLTISGTPTTAGTYTYTVTTSSCNPVTKTGTITVTSETISLSSAVGTDAQTPCLNSAITNITYSLGVLATGATVSGLPTGVTGSYSAGVFTISGTPTSAGLYNYTVTTIGSCATHATATGSINVRRQIITRTSAAGTNAQTLCVNTAITNITYSVSGTATGAGVTGLPTGVTGSYSAGVFTISGTPTVAGTYTYTVTTTGSCSSVTAGGTITVNGPSATLTSAVGTDAQSLCVNTAITDITYNIAGTATGASISGLPAGVNGSYNTGVFTISGTPTATGTFNYTITTSGGSCGTTTANGTITSNGNNTITLSSAVGTDAQTACISTAITNITYATTVATGATFSGLPTGVSGSWSANVATISGTPTAAGTSTYTVTLTGGCGSITANGTITASAANTAGAASSTPTLCINTALTAITHATTGATGIGSASGLPAGVSAAWASNTITISGTPTASGTFNYSIPLSGGCGTVNATGTITVTANKTAGAASSTPTLCINTALTAITHTTTGATGIGSASGLPAGVSAAWASNTITISGTPTASGTFNYSIPLSGGCGTVNATGTITVTANKTAGAASSTPTLCINTALTAITHTTTGATGIGSASGLPAGVTAAWASNTITISGTPTASGTFNYSIPLSGGCGTVNATGTITVTAANTAGAASSTPTLCINTALTAITHTTTGATGIGSASGLPAGVSAAWASNTITISGTPTASGTFNYSIPLSGGCGTVNATGTITVTANKTAGAASSTPTLCINTALTAITHTTTGATGIGSASGLPAGVTAAWASNTITISGTPTASGTFNYSIPLSGGCGTVNATGTITVNAVNTVTLTSAVGTDAQTVCINTAVTNITYSIGGSATGASITGLPAGVSGSYSAGVYTISGTPTASGTFNYTVTTTGGACTAASANGSIIVSPAAVGGTIADVSICYADNGSLSLTGNTGSVTRWETSTDLSSWTNIVNTTTTQSFTGLTQTTWYRALVQSGACASAAYSNNAKVGIHNLWTGQTSSDWNTGSNWSDGLTPTTSCPDVTIPLLTAPNVYPQLTSGVATVNNIIIYPSATMIVSNATLQVAGIITNNGSLNITGGTLELNGTSAAQTIAGSIFDTHTIQNLVISNSNGVSFANTNDTLSITGVLSFGTSNAVLNTNNNLTLVSNATGTASVADLTNGGTLTGTNIVGNVTVERYIPIHPKAWQFLAVPTSGQSIRNAWQEGNTTLANTRPGYGTTITGQMVGAVANGFDIYTPSGPSMKSYNSATNAWDGVANTSMQISNQKGYMFFVRGDRSVTTSSAPATATTLRTTGKLFTFGADAPASTTVLAGKSESIGNPYASAIDFRTITKPAAPAVDDMFYVWDPLLTNNYNGLGGYQTITAANGWMPIPGGTANYDASVAYPYIQSGQAFIMHATGAGGTVSFSEVNKVSQYSMANRISTRMADRQFMRLNLFTSGMQSDGNVVAFDADFSNVYDANDALKQPNTNENFGIKKDDKALALEARSPVVSQDTVFFAMSKMTKPSYHLRFNPANMAPGLTAIFVDKFLNTTTAVSTTDSSSYDFAITAAPGSYAADRFYMIFNQAPAAEIISIAANRNTTSAPVSVNWTVAHEAGMLRYEVQRGTNGVDFATINEINPSGNNTGTFSYNAIDLNAARGTNYYRVKGLQTNGNSIYSAIVKVLPGKNEQPSGRFAGQSNSGSIEVAMIDVYPNPVVDKIVNLQFINQVKGAYKVELINNLGEKIYGKTTQVYTTRTLETLKLDRTIVAGNYQLRIIAPDNTITVKQVIIQ